MDELETYITLEGPFDAALAFSQGASLVATLIIRRATHENCLDPLIKFAIFLSAGIPLDYTALVDGQVEGVASSVLGEVINLPTAHIWGQNDEEYHIMSMELSSLCKTELKEEFVHGGGHEIPSSRVKDAMIRTVNVIKRTATRASVGQ